MIIQEHNTENIYKKFETLHEQPEITNKLVRERQKG